MAGNAASLIHATRHAKTGPDPITPAAIGAAVDGLPPYAPTTLQNRYDPKHNTYNWKPSNTRRVNLGLGRAAKGGVSQHLVISDSSGAGCVNSAVTPILFDRPGSWPFQMRGELSRHGVPIGGSGIYRLVDGTQYPSHMSTTGTWAPNNAYLGSSSNGATWTITVDRAGTAVSVDYYDYANCTFTVSVDGATSGAGFRTVTAGNLSAYRRVTLLGLTVNVGSTVKITKTNTSLSIFLGAQVWSPDVGGLVVHNASQSGSKITGTGTTSWSDNTQLGLAYQRVAGVARTVTDAAFTSGSATVSSATAAFKTDDIGRALFTLTGVRSFPENTYLLDVAGDGLSATMSQNAIATGSAVSLTIGKAPDCIHISLGGNDGPVATTAIATMTAGITTIRNTYPNSDCILYIEEQQADAYMTAANWEAYAGALYTLADTLDVPLIDIRDRIGSYATASPLGYYGDAQAHLTAAAYADWGRNVGMVMAG